MRKVIFIAAGGSAGATGCGFDSLRSLSPIEVAASGAPTASCCVPVISAWKLC
jgi:hypothetical protein